MRSNAERLRTHIVKQRSQYKATQHFSDQLAIVMEEGSGTSLISYQGPKGDRLTNSTAHDPNLHPDHIDASDRVRLNENNSATRRLLETFGHISDSGKAQEHSRRFTTIDQIRNLDGRRSEVEPSLLSTIRSSVSSVSDSQAKLVTPLLIDAAYGSIKLSDSDLDSRKSDLASQLARIGSTISKLTIDKVPSTDGQKENFVLKWGGR